MSDVGIDGLDPMDVLATAWVRPPFTELTGILYMKGLADIPADELRSVVGELFLTHPGERPQVATIRRLIAEKRAGFPPDDVAWKQARGLDSDVLERSVPLGARAAYAPRHEAHPAVRAAFGAVGVEHRPSFLKAYREERERTVVATAARSMVVADSLPAGGRGGPAAIERPLGER